MQRTARSIPHRILFTTQGIVDIENPAYVLLRLLRMGAAEPPYLYDAPSQRPVSFPYSSFEPKRVTNALREQSSYASRPKSTQSGPLIDFNRHPDSYMVVTGSDLNHKPLPASTKKWVTVIRWIQFTLRALTLLGAMGVLFCIICLKPTDLTQAWIMRITVSYPRGGPNTTNIRPSLATTYSSHCTRCTI